MQFARDEVDAIRTRRRNLLPCGVFTTTRSARPLTLASCAANQQPTNIKCFAEPSSDSPASYSRQSESKQDLFLFEEGDADGCIPTIYLPSTNTDYTPSVQEQYVLLILVLPGEAMVAVE